MWKNGGFFESLNHEFFVKMNHKYEFLAKLATIRYEIATICYEIAAIVIFFTKLAPKLATNSYTSNMFSYGFGSSKAQKTSEKASPAASIDVDRQPRAALNPPSSSDRDLIPQFAISTSATSSSSSSATTSSSSGSGGVRIVPSPNNTVLNKQFMDAKVAVGCECCRMLLKRLHKKEEVEVRLRADFKRQFDSPCMNATEKELLNGEVMRLKRIITAMNEAQEELVDVVPCAPVASQKTVVASLPEPQAAEATVVASLPEPQATESPVTVDLTDDNETFEGNCCHVVMYPASNDAARRYGYETG